MSDLVQEVFYTDDDHRTLHLAEDPRRIGQTVGHPGTLGDDVAGGEASIWALGELR